MDEVEADFRAAATQPKGRLRVDLPMTFARLEIIPRLPDFCARYPQIELDIRSSDRFVDLLREGVDCVLRVGELGDLPMVGHRVGALRMVTVASSGYVRRHGRPKTLADLHDGHCAVNWVSPTTGRPEPLDFMVGRRKREVSLPSAIMVNSSDAYTAGCLAGLGLAQLTRYRVGRALEAGEMVELLPEFPPPSLPVSVLYPPRRQQPARLRVFIDWLVGVMAEVVR